jgi:hypothetical protein
MNYISYLIISLASHVYLQLLIRESPERIHINLSITYVYILLAVRPRFPKCHGVTVWYFVCVLPIDVYKSRASVQCLPASNGYSIWTRVVSPLSCHVFLIIKIKFGLDFAVDIVPRRYSVVSLSSANQWPPFYVWKRDTFPHDAEN